jgi:NUC153 domain
LGLAHLVGTDMLKPYMHGFFVHMRLYRRAVDAASPFAYEQYRKERAKEKIEADRESRIGKTRKRSTVSAAKVNRSIAQQLERKQAESAGKKGETAAAAAASILEDDRFSAMFRNADFKVDEADERFLHLNPSGVADNNPAAGTRRGRATEDSSDDSDAEYLEQFDAIDEDGGAAAAAAAERIGGLLDSDNEGSEDDSGDDAVVGMVGSDGDSAGDRISKPRSVKKRPRMFELNEAAEVMGGRAHARRERSNHRHVVEKMPLGERVTGAKRSKKLAVTRPSRPARKSKPV